MMESGGRNFRALPLAALLLAAGIASPASAHTSQSAFVLLLPRGLYITGGAVVVAVSFLLIALVPLARARAAETFGWPAGRLPQALGTALSLASFLVMTALVLAGRLGTQDPLANPLPLVVWTLGWIGLTAAHALFGDLWSALNPWRGLHALLCRLPELGGRLARPPLAYPERLGYWPAFVQFLAFAWFELIFTVPQNPEILANVVAGYFTVNLIGTLLFGRAAWLRHGEAFSVFFRMVAWLSPLNGRPDGDAEVSGRIVATLPGLGLLHVQLLPLSGVAFVLLALGAVSFDGLSKTYWWLALIGVNPLDFPGRSAVALSNGLGLLAAFAVLMSGYAAAIWLGHLLAGQPTGLRDSLRGTVISIVPIALGYQVAHYLTAFLVDAQYAAITLSDPFDLGWDLFGLGDTQVTTSFLSNFHAVRLIWHCQIAVIVIAHVAAVSIAHLIAARQAERPATAILRQLPLTVLMIAYTQFGLWLLSTASLG